MTELQQIQLMFLLDVEMERQDVRQMDVQRCAQTTKQYDDEEEEKKKSTQGHLTVNCAW